MHGKHLATAGGESLNCLPHRSLVRHVPNTSRNPEAEIEIGWRLATSATGKGYATEAGKAAARYAFDFIGVDTVVAVAHPDNISSHKVMQRIGMTFRGIETHYDEDCTTYVLHRPDIA